mgnify:FL=1
MYKLDSRTPEEYIQSHVEGAINIPYLLKEESGNLDLY